MVEKLKSWFRQWRDGRSQSEQPDLPPLPHHPQPGLTVQEGESLTITDIRLSLENVGTEDADPRRAKRKMHVPDWSTDFCCGATFQLRHPLDPVYFNVDGCRAQIGADRYTFDVGLPEIHEDPLPRSLEVAEKTLDLMTADLFLSTALYEPLREHSVWWREGDRTTLRGIWTERLGTMMSSSAVVRDATGQDKPMAKLPARRWHPSHAYFRESQVSDNLHDAYRNLFLALEALLSGAYPWRRGIGERAWLQKALKHVCQEYEIDLSTFLDGKSGNPYKRFLREQYEARRCALFHAKLSLTPITPRDMMSRAELAAATNRLARLYMAMARRFTGARFAGSVLTYAGFEQMMGALEGSEMFVTVPSELQPPNGAVAGARLERRFRGRDGVHAALASWSVSDIPGSMIDEAGIFMKKDTESFVGMRCDILVDLTGVDILELALQLEMVNLRHLRE